MRPRLFAVAEIPPQFPDAIRLGLIQGLLDYGRKFVVFVNTAAQADPDRFLALSDQLRELQTHWLGGESFSDRADEDDLRARHALWAAQQLPGLARLAAKAVLELPTDHPLRDVAAVREALLHQLRGAIRSEFGAGYSFDSVQRADLALSAIGGLIKHDLVPADRLTSLFEAGTRLLETPALQRDHPFRLDALSYVRARSVEAAEAGNEAEAERWDVVGRNLLRPVLEAETDPQRTGMLRLILSDFGDDAENFTGTLQELVASTAPEAGWRGDRERKLAIFSRLMSAQRSFANGEFSEVVGAVTPVLPSLMELYLSAVADADVSESGSWFSQACQLLALSHAHLAEWDRALTHIDQCKSLRFRYQSALRAAAGGERVVELEAALYAHDRGIAALPPDLDQDPGRGIQASPQSRLLEAYRQVRTSLSPDDMDSPGIGDIAGLLDQEEAVAVLGLCTRPVGVLLAVICPGDARAPTGRAVLPVSAAQELVRSFIDPVQGWLIALRAPGIGVEPRPSLGQLIDAVDSVIGAPLRRMLADRTVRRLTVIPHSLLHLVPFWALPSLEGLEVVAAPSAAQFVKQRAQRPTISRGSLVVGNPTGDLEFAALEAQRVAARLRAGGFEARLLEPEHATERDISESLVGASVFHFSGHGLSDMFRPLLSGLEARPDARSLGEDGADPLPTLAAAAAWQPMQDNERRADLPDGRCLYEHVYPVTNRVELRLESGDRGTLRGRYVWEDDEEGRYGLCLRLAELLTAGDLLQEKALRDCGFVFLSSCNAGLGGLSPDVDEFAGLPAALQLAGASIVVSPLWPVDEVTAALFADLFYAEVASAAGEVDVPALVGEVRVQMRRMDAEEAANRIEGFAAEAGTLLEKTLLSARALKVRQGPELPFEHAFDWAAFHAVGAPAAAIEARPGATRRRQTGPAKSLRGQPPSRPRPHGDSVGKGEEKEAAVQPQAQTPPDDAESAARSEDVDIATAWDTLARATADPVVHEAAAEALVERGGRLLDAGKIDDAVADFTRALELQPGLAAGHLGLGLAHADRSQLDSAITEYTAAIAADPDRAAAYRKRGDTFLKLERWTDAIADYDRLLELAPSPLDQCSRGVAHRSRGDHDLAIGDFTQVVEELPEYALAYYFRAESYADQQKLSLAVADLDIAVFLSPRDAEVVHLRGFLHMAQRQLDLALADFDAALAIDPAHAPAFYNRACVRSLAEEGRRWPPLAFARRAETSAITADLETAIGLDPELADSARTDPDLAWARRRVQAVRRLLAGDAG
ncbi:MAG TPA: CHAT domain-containing protein [Gaiellaceae bacterium]|nr:CHAT domain-containing protein [Gaiellaceae bacterium]